MAQGMIMPGKRTECAKSSAKDLMRLECSVNKKTWVEMNLKT